MRTVLITGAAGGIGNAICKKFKSEGWFVIGLDKVVSEENMDDFIQVDLLEEDFVSEIKINKLDCLVNCAGTVSNGSLIETTIEQWNEMMDCNVKAVYLLIKKVYPLLKEAKGSIVNISSIHATHTSPNTTIYACSKGALTSLTRAMSLEFIKDGIRVNSVLPGAVDTPLLRKGLKKNKNIPFKKKFERFKRRHVLGRIGRPEEIAEAVYFLGENNKSSFIVGHSLVVDGGESIRLRTN